MAVAEVVALGVRISRVADDQDWERAAAHVREHFQESDAVGAAPGWADPLLRLHLGDKITTRVAGRSSLSAYERLWVLTLRGARAKDSPPRAPDFSQPFGRVVVERYDFGPSPSVVELPDALADARVKVGSRVCKWNARAGGHTRGGLGQGPVFPRQRFICDPRKKWNWVGTTVMEDLALKPRRCIWQHPVGKQPVSVTFPNVHLGTHLVFDGGVYFYHERDFSGADVEVRVSVDGREVGRFRHKDGDGFKRWRIDTLKGRDANERPRGDLRIETRTSDPRRRSFCWTGSIRDAERREGP